METNNKELVLKYLKQIQRVNTRISDISRTITKNTMLSDKYKEILYVCINDKYRTDDFLRELENKK